jgi:hypothetical protein
MALKIDQIKDLQDNSIINKSGNTITLGASNDTITVPNTVTVAGAMANTPAFFAYKSSSQDLTSGVTTKVTFDTEVFDTDSAYDAANSKFVVPSGEAGKYVFNLAILTTCPEATNRFDRALYFYYVNGVDTARWITDFRTGYGSQFTSNANIILDLNESDYVEAYCQFVVTAGTARLNGSGYYYTTFQGHKLTG